MTTFVLVHGAWHGPWAWDRLTPLLEGNDVRTVAPTLSIDRASGLDTHVQEVVATLDELPNDDVVLVGHSYAGLVVRQAADLRPERVKHIVLIDGWVGRDGSSLFGLAPESFVNAISSSAQTTTDGLLIPAPPAGAFGITDPDDLAWLSPRLQPQPLLTFTEKTTLTGAVDLIPGTAVCCQPGTYAFAHFAAEVGYRTVYLTGPHNLMVTNPQALADVLLEVLSPSEVADTDSLKY